MKLAKSVMNILHRSISEFPPETGGILGSRNNKYIDEVIMDSVDSTNVRPCSYYPNVDFLNSSIACWQDEDISFMGIFHTHFMGVKTLSAGDKKYIEDILHAMPPQIDFLYFPIYVLPNRELVCYKAVMFDRVVKIEPEDIVIEYDC